MKTSSKNYSCQICDSNKIEAFLFLGQLPLVNNLQKLNQSLKEESRYPAEMFYCHHCGLVQLGFTVDEKILFSNDYPYTSRGTKLLCENFFDLAVELGEIISLHKNDLVVDVGSNDGNLLSYFKDKCRVLGVTPENIAGKACELDIPTIQSYFDDVTVQEILKKEGKAKIVTATYVLPHVSFPHQIMKRINTILKSDGIFICEFHSLQSLLEANEFDTIYHEHSRYFSLNTMIQFLNMHELEVFRARKILAHGGSLRIMVARKGFYPVEKNVSLLRDKEININFQTLLHFKKKVVQIKLDLISKMKDIKSKGARIIGISAASRATTLINYVGLDDGIIDSVVEVSGSLKLGHMIPGTKIPILDEKILYQEQPDFALLLSWHLANDLIPKIRKKGFKGQFIVPLPNPQIL